MMLQYVLSVADVSKPAYVKASRSITLMLHSAHGILIVSNIFQHLTQGHRFTYGPCPHQYFDNLNCLLQICYVGQGVNIPFCILETLWVGRMIDDILWVIKWAPSFFDVSLIDPRHLQRVQQ